MAENSNIEWTDHTFNPWSGCTKVSPACDHCYAEVNYSVKMRGVKWGKYGNRIIASDAMWKQPLKWNREAEASGQRKRVFCASLADVFEGPESMPDEAVDAVFEARRRLLFLMLRATPSLNWLLLTKRPDKIREVLLKTVEGYWNDPADVTDLVHAWLDGTRIPHNVWIGTTVENQKWADIRIPELLKIPAKVRFLSVEPMLGPIEFSNVSKRSDAIKQLGKQALDGIDWVICGGESGSQARPMHPGWARSLRDQCNAAGVPFLFKQWGEWWPIGQMPDGMSDGYYDPKYGRSKRDEYDDRPARKAVETTVLQLDGTQEFAFSAGAMTCFKVGKKAAGRILDGRTWDEYPQI